MNTEFDTVNKQIIHSFNNGCKVVTDIRTATTYKMNTKGDVVEKFSISTMPVTEYTEWIMNLEKSLTI